MDQERLRAIIDQASSEPTFRRTFLADPEGVMKQHGLTLPDGVKVRVVEDASDVMHIVLPPLQHDEELSDRSLDRVSGGHGGTARRYNDGRNRP